MLGNSVDFRFLLWSSSHEYSFEMNDSNVADQPRLVYWLQLLHQNQKNVGIVDVGVRIINGQNLHDVEYVL